MTEINRLFRADTIHDVMSAAIVVSTLPVGRDVLLISSDNVGEPKEEHLESLKNSVKVWNWSAVVDISGLPMLRHWKGDKSGLRWRWERMKDTIESLNILRRRIANAFELNTLSPSLKQEIDKAVHEIYLTCLYHSDVQAIYTICPSSRKIYCPHGFGSLHEAEIFLYDPICSGKKKSSMSIQERLSDKAKHLLWGEDALPVRSIQIDISYSFRLSAPWAREQRLLHGRLNPETMWGLFSRLPGSVQEYYRSLNKRVLGKIGLLLITAESPEDTGDKYNYEILLKAFERLARKMINDDGVTKLLVKPHPRNGREWVGQTMARISQVVGDIEIILVDRFHHYPIEVVLAPINIAVCAGAGTSSLRTLAHIYDIKAYCAERSLIEFYAPDPLLTEATRRWILDNGSCYVPV